MRAAVLLLVLLMAGPAALAQRVPQAAPAPSRPEAASPLARGVALLNARRPAEAVPLLETALRADSLHEAPFAALVTAYLAAGRYRNAETTAGRGLRRFPSSLELARLRAEALVGREALPEALAAYRPLERRGGAVVRARIGALERALGVRAAQAGRLDEAAAHLEQARERLPDSVSVVRELASVYLERAAWAPAQAAAEAGLARFPNDAFLLRARAVALARAGEPAARLDAFAQLFRRDTTDIPAGLTLAEALAQNRRPQEAWELLLRLGNAHPDDRRVFEAQAALAMSALNPGAALGALRQVRRLAPTDATVLVRIGEAYESLRAWEAARAAYDSAAVLTGEVQAARLRVARTFVRQDTLQAALVRYRDLIFAQPDSVALLQEAAAVYEIAGRWADARRVYETLGRHGAWERWRLGRALERTAALPAARVAYRQALAEGAPHPFALWRLAVLDSTGQGCALAERGVRLAYKAPGAGAFSDRPSGTGGAVAEFQARADSAEVLQSRLLHTLSALCPSTTARRTLSVLASQNTGEVTLRLALAKLAAAAGDTVSALRELVEATRRAPRQADVHVALGRQYEAYGQLGEARASYERALSLAPAAPERYRDLARVAGALGVLDALLDRWRARLRTTPADAVLREELSQALAQAGRTTEAAALRAGGQ